MLDAQSEELIALLRAIAPETAERFYTHHGVRPEVASAMSAMFGAVPNYLLDPDNKDVAGTVLEVLSQVHALKENGPGLIIRAHYRYGLQFDQNAAIAELALRLTLDNPIAFQFARSRLAVGGAGSSVSVWNLKGFKVDLTTESVLAFEEAVRSWFGGEGKGRVAQVKHYTDSGETIVLVERGTYFDTKPFWKDQNQIAVDPRRPVVEDVIAYDPATFELRVGAPHPKDRETYLRLFALHIIGDPQAADTALARVVFTLEPFQSGAFSYEGKGPVKAVVLVGARVRIYGASNCVAWFSADDFRRSLQYDLGTLSLDAMQLLAVKLRFHLQPPGEPRATRMTLTIQPPSHTDAGEKRYLPLVMSYLRDQGVRLG